MDKFKKDQLQKGGQLGGKADVPAEARPTLPDIYLPNKGGATFDQVAGVPGRSPRPVGTFGSASPSPESSPTPETTPAPLYNDEMAPGTEPAPPGARERSGSPAFRTPSPTRR